VPAAEEEADWAFEPVKKGRAARATESGRAVVKCMLTDETRESE